MEGISGEAAALAGALHLNKLIVFWDNNNITIDGTVDQTSMTDQIARFKAYGWEAYPINGHRYEEIIAAIDFSKIRFYAIIMRQGQSLPLFFLKKVSVS
jgi:transketolase